MSARNSRLAGHARPILCYVTDRRSLKLAPQQEAIAVLVAKIQDVISASVDWVQIREKDLSGRELSTLTREALHCATVGGSASARTRILVNDRVDVALTERAGGVHLTETSVRPDEARKLLQSSAAGRAVSENFFVGVSCHSLGSAQRAAEAGADYIFFGPIFATPSKAEYGPPQGLVHLVEVCRSVSIPVVAIGGITLENAGACLAAGAKGIAAIRLFQDAPELGRVVRELRALLV